MLHVQTRMQICAYAWILRWTKNCGKSGLGRGLPGYCGPPGRPAVRMSQDWAVGSGLWAAGCAQRAVGRWAFGKTHKPQLHDFHIQSNLLHHQFCVSSTTNYQLFTVTFSNNNNNNNNKQ